MLHKQRIKIIIIGKYLLFQNCSFKILDWSLAFLKLQQSLNFVKICCNITIEGIVLKRTIYHKQSYKYNFLQYITKQVKRACQYKVFLSAKWRVIIWAIILLHSNHNKLFIDNKYIVYLELFEHIIVFGIL